MNEQRKKIIISEIKYWKQSDLLPKYYCDFLIYLYVQREDKNEQEADSSNSILIKENKQLSSKIMKLISLTIIASACIFTSYPAITVGLSVAIVFIFLLYAMRNSITKSKVIPLLYILSAFMLLIMSLEL